MKKLKFLSFIMAILLCSSFTACKKPEKQDNSLNTALTVPETQDEGDSRPDYTLDDVNITFTNNNSYAELGISDQINDLIKNYFVLYYKALGSFENAKFDSLFCAESLYDANIVNAMVSYQNGIRERFDFDMQYKDANVGVTYRSITNVTNGVDVYLAENNSMSFNFIPDTVSYTSDVEHHFVIKEDNGKLYIYSHSEISGVYDLIIDGFEKYTDGMYDYDIAEIFNIVQAHFVETTDRELNVVFKEREEYNNSPDSFVTTLTADNEYDVDAALAYSYEWAGKTEAKRNPYFGMYDIYGGNCNNFTSQCLFAGGIPMDLQGIQWKWYGEAVNSTGGAYGRSPSWAECDYFYAYCTQNEGYGLVCDPECNLYSGKPGDLIQYVVGENDAVHTVIITKVIYDENGNVIDYLINSNTTDKVDCPMSTYGYTNFRLIKIIGWNN